MRVGDFFLEHRGYMMSKVQWWRVVSETPTGRVRLRRCHHRIVKREPGTVWVLPSGEHGNTITRQVFVYEDGTEQVRAAGYGEYAYRTTPDDAGVKEWDYGYHALGARDPYRDVEVM